MLALLVILLFILSLVAYIINDREFIAPSVLFSLSFLFATFFALINQKRWDINLSINTFGIILGGVTEFIILSFVLKLLIKNKPYFNQKIIMLASERRVTYKLMLIIFIQIVNIFLIIKGIKSATGSNNLSVAVNLLNSSTNGFINSQIVLPRYANYASIFNVSVGIFFEYILAKEIAYKSCKNKYVSIAVILGLITPLFNGSRGTTIVLIISLVIFIFMCSYKMKNIKLGKFYFLLTMGIILVLIFLQSSAILLGRTSEVFSQMDYISMYVGAEIKNLDTFIKNGAFPVKQVYFGQQTFRTQISILYKVFGLNFSNYNLVLPFQWVNGISLGNVYTIFYPWLYDFGYVGVPVVIVLVVLISQGLYNFTKISKSMVLAPISKLFYGLIGSNLVLSFFSNKFFENITISFIYYLIVWTFLNYFFETESFNIMKGK